jgi:hypothetical protein
MNNSEHVDPRITSGSQHSISFSRRTLMFAIAALCMFLCSAFFGGYFWGKRSAALQFMYKIEQDSFADQIYASLCALYDYDPVSQKTVPIEITASDHVPEQLEEITMSSVSLVQDSAQGNPAITENNCDEATQEISPAQKENISTCYAELVGFGAEQSALLFSKKLQKKGYDVAVKKRISTTAKKKKVAWFQVVTSVTHDKDALQEMVDRISQEEKLKGIKIIHV